ncbi:sn-glycerol-3-phosphate ABC transporter permease UgpE [Devosia sp. J2-20]|jgi:sn-glycerol 3-phosphate transport system permease protein|uniref:sn-glycerol-3-phosphate transport system permease protein UgpE n=1 Tax=Devosia litorisediminis TaxID=2829817 RepID=A0A942E6P3_9HYPH|nr:MULTISPECIES: sn-glycerol-3-phosphate ABC transporter permease UgpE [Devosia]MBS3849238.1 sn-glycerol-3-phosphate ABC transporter permease UgpE [Devosia litorisediminis]WDQ97701.1 sn-glycerol-3-phosphate ABC transporter permease UgpE [Devosia sp. J2-20]
MVENRPFLTVLTHLFLIAGVIVVIFPVYIAVVAATHGPLALSSGAMPMLPGSELINNIMQVLTETRRGVAPFWLMAWNSLMMAVLITVGKIAISIISAYAIVYFRFPGRLLVFWLIFITLMLPVEVRIIPTFKVVADLGLLNSYAGLTIPLIASATATFLFRQFFMTIPDELMEAARVDGAGPMKFFRDILLPLSRTNIAALCVILFIYGWMQYLWPLLVTTDPKYYTLMMGVKRMATVADSDPQWNIIMAAVVLAMLPPVLIVIFMQRLFVKGLVETEK